MLQPAVVTSYKYSVCFVLFLFRNDIKFLLGIKKEDGSKPNAFQPDTFQILFASFTAQHSTKKLQSKFLQRTGWFDIHICSFLTL